MAWDTHVTVPAFGFENVDNYYYKASCYHQLANIKVPTFIMMAKDDPIIGSEAICFEIAK